MLNKYTSGFTSNTLWYNSETYKNYSKYLRLRKKGLNANLNEIMRFKANININVINLQSTRTGEFAVPIDPIHVQTSFLFCIIWGLGEGLLINDVTQIWTFLTPSLV